MKNPDRNIVYTAVAEFLANGTPIEKTIKECGDIRQFITIRTVKGGAVFDGKKIGKSVRFYSCKSVDFFDDNCLYYAINGNKVPGSAGCRPLMDLDGMPDDVDFNSYISDANKLLKDVGYDLKINGIGD